MGKVIRFTGAWHGPTKEGAPQPYPILEVPEDQINRVRIPSWPELFDEGSITYDACTLSYWREGLYLGDKKSLDTRLKIEKAVFEARRKFIEESGFAARITKRASYDLATETFKIGTRLRSLELQQASLALLAQLVNPQQVARIADDLRIEVRREELALNGRLRT